MENLMNKIAGDLKNFAPEAPIGMEERIQSALSKKKSFWASSWYTMNVYVVALVGASVLALIFSNRGESNVVAQSVAPAAAEVKAIASAVADVNTNDQLILNAAKESKSTPVKTTRERKIVQVETNTSALVVENCQTTVIAEPAAMEVAETVEVQRMPEEIQVPKAIHEVVKPKGRSLRLTRLTGK
jgi:cytoskeletal protein RodZ